MEFGVCESKTAFFPECELMEFEFDGRAPRSSSELEFDMLVNVFSKLYNDCSSGFCLISNKY